MEIPCFKGLDPYQVIEALNRGFDAVMAVVCSDVDCKLEKGYDVAERNATVLKRALKEFGLLERFDLYTASPRKVGDFENRLKAFIKKIGSMPPISSQAPSAVMAGEI
jgi:coenzyme F420-reducing hydrogenase delta subunit